MRLLAYGTLAGGFLSERWLGRDEPGPGDIGDWSKMKYRRFIDAAGGWEAFQGVLRTLDGVARRLGATIPQLACRWVLDQPAVGAVILGVGRRARAEDRRAVVDLTLGDEDIRRIDAHLATQPVPPGDTYALERDPSSPHSRIIRTNLQGTVP